MGLLSLVAGSLPTSHLQTDRWTQLYTAIGSALLLADALRFSLQDSTAPGKAVTKPGDNGKIINQD